MTPKMLRNAGLTSITALSLALVACGGSSSSAPPAPVNLAPINLSIAGPDAVATSHVKDYALNATDPEGKGITYTVTASAGTVALTGNVAKLTAPATVGSVILTMTAKDADGAIATATKAVTVNANQAPVFDNNLNNNGTAQVTAIVASTTTVNLNATDKDGDSVTVAASGTLPAWAVFNATTKVLTLNPALANVQVLPYLLNFVATDGFGGTTALSVQVQVSRGVNNPPSTPVAIASPNNRPYAGRTLTWTLGAVDIDGDAISFLQSPVSDPEVTISGNTLSWTPTKAYNTGFPVAAAASTEAAGYGWSGKTVYVIAKDARDAISILPLQLQLPAVDKNTSPSWYGDNSSHPTGDGHGGPMGQLQDGYYYNAAPDYSEDGGSSWVQKTPIATGTLGGYSIPTTATLYWDAANLEQNDHMPVFASDYEDDALSFSVIPVTGSGLAGTVPTAFAIDGNGVVTWSPVIGDNEKLFAVRLVVSDGLLSRTSDVYRFETRPNVVPQITKALTGDVWLDTHSTASTQTSVPSANLTWLDANADGARFEPVSFTNANVWLGDIVVDTPTASGNYTPTFIKDTGYDWRQLVPFQAETLTYRVRDNWDGVSADQTVIVKGTGKAKFNRSVNYMWPGNSSTLAETATATLLQPKAVGTGFLGNLTGALPAGAPDVNGLYDIMQLKQANYWRDLVSAHAFTASNPNPTAFPAWPAFLTYNTNGGDGATVTTEVENVFGRPFASRVIDTTTTINLSGGSFEASAIPVAYNPQDAFSRFGNGTAGGFAASAARPFYANTTPGGMIAANLGSKTWTGTDWTGTGATTQGFYGLTTWFASQSNGAGAITVGVGPVPPADTTFDLVFKRSLFNAEFAKSNVISSSSAPNYLQAVYIAKGYKAATLGLSNNMTLPEEVEMITGRGISNAFPVFMYVPSGQFVDGTAKQGVDVILDKVAFANPTLLDHDTFYTATVGAIRGGFPFSVGIRTATPFSAANPVAPKIGPVSAPKFVVSNANGTVATLDALSSSQSAITSYWGNYVSATAYNNLSLTWTAPTTGTAAEYEVELWDYTTGLPKAKIITTATRVDLQKAWGTVPANTHYIRIRAKAAAGNPLEQAWADLRIGFLF